MNTSKPYCSRCQALPGAPHGQGCGSVEAIRDFHTRAAREAFALLTPEQQAVFLAAYAQHVEPKRSHGCVEHDMQYGECRNCGHIER